MTARVGFIGLGAMGGPMALRLVRGGVPLSVWSRNPQRCRAAISAGATMAPDPATLAADCTVVISCLLDDHAVEEVYLGRAVIESAPHETVFVEHGTFSPELARRLAQTAAQRGGVFVDAPVTGGVVGARAGTLTCMAGTSIDVVDRLRPIVGHYAAMIEPVGPPGVGAGLKLVNQMLVATHVAAAAEATALIAALGIAPDVAHRVLTSGWANSAMLERNLLPALRHQPIDDGAQIGHLLPVLALVARTAETAEVPTAVEPVVHAQFQRAEAAGLGGDDLSALADLYLTTGDRTTRSRTTSPAR